MGMNVVIQWTQPTASGPIYNDGTYKYFGEAKPASPLTSPVWKVSRMNISTSYVQWVDGGRPTQVYTDVATVAALSFA